MTEQDTSNPFSDQVRLENLQIEVERLQARLAALGAALRDILHAETEDQWEVASKCAHELLNADALKLAEEFRKGQADTALLDGVKSGWQVRRLLLSDVWVIELPHAFGPPTEIARGKTVREALASAIAAGERKS